MNPSTKLASLYFVAPIFKYWKDSVAVSAISNIEHSPGDWPLSTVVAVVSATSIIAHWNILRSGGVIESLD